MYFHVFCYFVKWTLVSSSYIFYAVYGPEERKGTFSNHLIQGKIQKPPREILSDLICNFVMTIHKYYFKTAFCLEVFFFPKEKAVSITV